MRSSSASGYFRCAIRTFARLFFVVAIAGCLGATNFSPEKGAYKLSTKTWSGAITACNQVFAAAGTSTNQLLDNNDCKRGTRWADKVTLYLRAGETVQMTMNSSVFYPTIEVDRRVNGVWTKVTQAAANTVTAGTGGLAVVEVDAESLPAGACYIAASHASGSFVLIQRDLHVMRRPTNLVDIRA